MHVPSSRIIPPSIKSPVNIFFLPSFNIFFIVALIYTFHKYCIRLSYMCLSYYFGISVVAIASPQITVSITSTTISPMIFSLSFHLFSLVSFCYLIAQSESHNQITAPTSIATLIPPNINKIVPITISSFFIFSICIKILSFYRQNKKVSENRCGLLSANPVSMNLYP